MQKTFVYFFTILIISALTLTCLYFNSQNKDEIIIFLNGYGWEVSKKPIETVPVAIPEKFDDVYSEYNRLQKEAGLDLTPYKGKKAIRYTYIVTNYPIKLNDTVYANVLTVNNIPIAGDIMTRPIDGFMHSLSQKKP